MRISQFALVGFLSISQLATAAPASSTEPQHKLTPRQDATSQPAHDPLSQKVPQKRHRSGEKRRHRRPSRATSDGDFFPTNRHPLLDGYGAHGWERDIVSHATERLIDRDASHPNDLVGITPALAQAEHASDDDDDYIFSRAAWAERLARLRSHEENPSSDDYLQYLFTIVPPASARATRQHSRHWIVQHVRPPFPLHSGRPHRAHAHPHREHHYATICHRLAALKEYSLAELRRLSSSATPSAAYMSARAGDVYRERVAPALAYLFCQNPTGMLMGGLFLVFLLSIATREVMAARRTVMLRRQLAALELAAASSSVEKNESASEKKRTS